MSWRDSLLQGSFRDVPFEIDTATGSGQPKLVIHEYPQSDRNELEYLGRGPKRFQLQMFVFTHDGTAQRDQLENALDDSEAGALVHPYRGTLRVGVENWSCVESKQYGGLATFTAGFVLDPDEALLPAASVDTQAQTQQCADAADVAASSDFADTFSISDAIDRALSLDSLTAVLAPIAAAVDAAFELVDAVDLQLVRALLDPLAGARAILQDIVDLPAEVAARITSLVSKITAAADLTTLIDKYSSSDADSLGILANAYGVGGTEPYGGVVIRSDSTGGVGDLGARAAANMAAIGRIASTAVAVRIARLTASTDYASYSEAVAAIDSTSAVLDAVSADTGDAGFTALQDLRAAVVADLRVRAANLAVITSFTPRETLPALVIAHTLYGVTDVSGNADEIVRRNGIGNPCRVSGGQALEVLVS